METELKKEKSIVTNVYDEDGESYGVFVEFCYERGPESWIISFIRWQYLANVKPNVPNAMDDIKDGIISNFPYSPIDFEL